MADNIRQFRSREERTAAEKELNKKLRRHRMGNSAAVIGFLLIAVLLVMYFYIDNSEKS